MDSRLVDILLDAANINTTKLVRYLAVNHPQVLIDFATDGPGYSKLGPVVAYIKSSNVISAIKEVRTLYGCGLKEAKDVVDYARGVTSILPRPVPGFTDLSGVAATLRDMLDHY